MYNKYIYLFRNMSIKKCKIDGIRKSSLSVDDLMQIVKMSSSIKLVFEEEKFVDFSYLKKMGNDEYIDPGFYPQTGSWEILGTTIEIKKYDPDGKMMARLKTQNLPTLLEPWFHPKIFAYYQKDMRIVNYNRMFEVSDDFKLDASIAIEPTLVCPTNDNRFLVLDEADLSIKKFENNQNRVLNEFKIDTTHWNKHFQFSFMREYLHLIFLLDKNQGIIIVNELGKTMEQQKELEKQNEIISNKNNK